MVLKRACLLALTGLVVGCVPSAEDIETSVYEVCYSGPARVSPSSAHNASSELVVPEIEGETLGLDGASVGLRSLAIASTDGGQGLQFVNEAHVDVAGRRILELPGPATELYGETQAPPNLMPYALEGDLRLVLAFSGAMPSTSWGIRVDACFSVDGVIAVP